MLRLTLSIVGGLVAAFALVFASDWVFHALIPSASAASADPNDREAMARYVASQPTGVLAGLVLGWAVAAFVGSMIASRFAERGAWPGRTVGGLFLLATAANFVMITHPTWMVVAAVIAIAAAASLGAHVGARTGQRVP